MRKLGIGVLGVGAMGKRHAENIRRLVPEAKLIAVADLAADQARTNSMLRQYALRRQREKTFSVKSPWP